MSQAHDSVISLLTVIVLLVLTAVATVLYNGNSEQRTKINNNLFWQKTRLVFDTAMVVLQDITDIGLNKQNISSQANGNKNLNQQSKLIKTNNGFWSHFNTKIKNAWEKSAEPRSVNSAKFDLERFFQWQPQDNGAEIIFRPESGIEYKLLLPFKFLSR